MTDPQEDESPYDKTNPGLCPAPTPPEEEGAQEKTNPGLVPSPFPAPQAPGQETIQLASNHPPFPESRGKGLPPPPSRVRHWLFGSLAILLLGGTLAYYLMYPSGESPAVFRGRPDVPPVLQPYLEKAEKGDSSAMRMLGTMYYNGLNVTQDRKEGIRWYRKAVAAGSVAARKDLEQLGLPVEEK